ncbi:hemicentin-1 [Plodia interpunctella]|uniref:hemicentin-1 n=1 Tax=Plodia interpunctella TaxID=58824 RepID=UPI002368A7F1|nr:hemicentin-1 [Plodia interpunctella]
MFRKLLGVNEKMGAQWRLSPFTLLVICAALTTAQSSDEEPHDTREGDDVTLQCRFSPERHLSESPAYYWLRNTAAGQDNVAIGNLSLGSNYRISFVPSEGRYDLLLSNVSYDRDNGRFECRVKAGGSGRTLHAQIHMITVLTPPRAPLLTPGAQAFGLEDKELNLTCSTSGGSPEPSVKWYRDGSSYPLEAITTHAKSRDEATIATLRLMPKKEDDGAIFRCVVSNRALPQGQQLDSMLKLSVNYYPRVTVVPENELRVGINATATLECHVDSKPTVNSVTWYKDGKFVSDVFVHTITGITKQDAGKYTCSADNGLGRPGEKAVVLDVLFPPTVTVKSKTYEAEEGGNIEVICEVLSNPKPSTVEWTKENEPDFRQYGNILLLNRVNADTAGTYTCRATNVMSMSDGKRQERSSSASVVVLVRHKPGRAIISPAEPKALEGTPLILTCSAEPPGWPTPQYRWFHNTDSFGNPIVLGTSNQHKIDSVQLKDEGSYSCQASNELGHAEEASVMLEVLQPPRFQAKLQTHMNKIAGEENFAISCTAIAKPRLDVIWLKDMKQIDPDLNLYEIKNEVSEGAKSVFTVQSTLRFVGTARPKGDDLIPADHGRYTCEFTNGIQPINATMHLRIEHEPILVQTQDRVAFDLAEVAKISCRVNSYPKPEFQWFYGTSSAPLQSTSEGHHQIDVSSDENESYLTVLKIHGVKSRDYGDYYCQVKNTLGMIRPKIRLQPKSAPETPQKLVSDDAGPSYVTLKWEAGFNGGLPSTKYFVRYRRIPRKSDGQAGDHCSSKPSDFDWMEFDCGRQNPCNVTQLTSNNHYIFLVKALNPKGQSNYSNEVTVTTKVDTIAPPGQVTYDPSSKQLVFSVSGTCLSLVGVAEGLTNSWQVIDTVPIQLSGGMSSVVEAALEPPAPARRGAALDDLNPRVRLKLCLRVNPEVCSEYTEAEIGQSYIKQTSGFLGPAAMIPLVCVIVIAIGLIVIVVTWRCRKMTDKNRESPSKDYEMNVMGSPMSPNQAPPPYYQSTGMENKALEHSMDLALEDSKNAVCPLGDYGYHGMPHVQCHSGQNMPNSEWSNNMYLENSYTNSNNGGSVNSHDSLWQLKMAAGNNGNMAHPIIDRQNNYAYDPMPGGYDTIQDYAPYPHLAHAQPAPADYNLRGSQNPSRQDFCSDPYASVHKPKKRMDQHIESPYHEVSGLPEAFSDAGADDKPPHLSINYDDSLESGYSTPNSRARRVIREIIV